jgi:hypothetical protein
MRRAIAGSRAFAAPTMTVPVSARSRTIEPLSRENTAWCTCTTARRKIARNGAESRTLETTASSSGLAWMSSPEPCSITWLTIWSEISLRTSPLRSATEARCAKGCASKISCRA